MLDFKYDFKELCNERMFKIEEQITDSIFINMTNILNDHIVELTEKDKSKGVSMENAIDYIKYMLVKEVYKQGFEDGRQFQQIAQPYIEIED